MTPDASLATGTAGTLLALRAYELAVHDDERPGWRDLLPVFMPSEPTMRRLLDWAA